MPTKQDRQILAKLKDLKKAFSQNEQRMREVAIHYEDLLAKKESLSTAIEDLKKVQTEKRRQSSNIAES
jgi:hypothetical protein